MLRCYIQINKTEQSQQLKINFHKKVGTVMTQLSLNQTIQSLVTDPESGEKRGILRNFENHPRKRPSSGLTSKGGNDVSSIGTATDFTRVRKLGYLPSYLKKETKSSVESELVTKYKKFKIAKKDLVEQQTNLMKNFEQLRKLKDKFKHFGGRDFKIESLEVIEFGSDGNDIGCGDGDHHIGLNNRPDSNCESQIFEFEREIQRIRGRVKDCLFKLIELNADAISQIQASGTEELQLKIQDIFSKVDEYVKSVNNEQDLSMQFLLENVQRLRNNFNQRQEMTPTNNSTVQDEEIASLRTAIQNLEVQGKLLQSEIDVKNREVEYLKNKEIVYSKSKDNCSDSVTTDNDQNELRLEILAQKDLINDYQNKQNEQLKLQQILEEKIKQLEDNVEQRKNQIEENLLLLKADLADEQKKNEELGKMLEETMNANSKTTSGASFETLSNQLAAANEDVKELQFKIARRDKQIQNLKLTIHSEANKTRDYDQLLIKYDQLRQQDLSKTKEVNQLKEKLVVRTDTINCQIASISELKKRLLANGTSGSGGVGEYATDHGLGPLQDDQLSKLSEHERIVQKLESNKIRSNLLRDQLLDRIAMLERENEDMKGQIRKFHEDFTINRFMYDEQRRKKRLTEILVKQYQK